MRFLHTGDLHLDSAFSSVGALDSSSRRVAQRELLRRIFHLAEKENCDMMLIAGDLFDSPYVSPETAALCIELFESFGRPIFISPGNHDPYTAGSFYATAHLPKNVHVFSSAALEYVELLQPAVKVFGYGFCSSAMMSSPLSAAASDKRETRILCAHGDLETPTSRYAPVMLSDVRRHGFDYVALGHVHNVENVHNSVRYCGFAEGRSFDELGEGGVLIVDLEPGGEPSVTRHTVCSQKYMWETLSVDGACDGEQLRSIIGNKLSEYAGGVPTHLRLELVGALPIEDKPWVAETDSYEGIASLCIIDNTLHLPDGGYLERDTTLRGEFYRSLRSWLFSEEPDKRALALKALKIGLAAIDGKDFVQGGEDQ